MANRPRAPRYASQQGTPENLPEGTPEELFQVGSIRHVMLEIGKLGVKVDRLVDDVKGQGEKIDGLRQQADRAKGAMWAIGAFVALLMLIFTAAAVVVAIIALRGPGSPPPPTNSSQGAVNSPAPSVQISPAPPPAPPTKSK